MYRLAWASGAVAAVFAVSMFAWLSLEEGEVEGAVRLSQEKRSVRIEFWRERIRAIGPGEAYEEMARSKNRVVPTDHIAAHIFGEALYREAGLPGFAVCDERFESGCAHQFVGLAISEHGIEVIETLREMCANSDRPPEGGTCVHAIGHGLLSYHGYTIEGLEGAMQTCASTFGPESGVCNTGVFMEYYSQQIISGGAIEARPVDENGLYGVCGEFDGGVGEWSCTYILPQWWFPLFEENPSLGGAGDMATKLGATCREVVPERLVDVCYGGIAYAIALRQFDHAQKASYCERATSDDAGALICKAHLHYWFVRFFAQWKLVGQDPAMACEGLLGDQRDFCLSYNPFASIEPSRD